MQEDRFLSCLIAEGNHFPGTDHLHQSNSCIFSLAFKLEKNAQSRDVIVASAACRTCVISSPLPGMCHSLCVGTMTRGTRSRKNQSSQTNLAPSKNIYRTVMFMGRLSLISLLAYKLKWGHEVIIKNKKLNAYF